MPNFSGIVTAREGVRTIDVTPNDVVTFTPSSATYTVEYPIGTAAIAAATTTQSLTGNSSATQMRILCVSGSVAYSCVDVRDDTSTLTPSAAAAVQAAFNTGLFLASAPLIIAKTNQIYTRNSANAAGDNTQTALFSFTLPAGCMGPNGTLRWDAETSFTDTATNATTLAFQLKIGAVGICPNYTVSSGTNDQRSLAWHNTSATAQKYRGSFVVQSSSAVAFTTTAIDTTVDQQVDFVCQWSGATPSEAARLEALRVWVEYGA